MLAVSGASDYYCHMARRILAIACIVMTGLAVTSTHAQQEFRPGIDCQCRGPQGQMYDLEERTCLRSDAGHRLATCVMNQNVTSWQFSEESCDVSRRNDLPRPAHDRPPQTIVANVKPSGN